MNRILLLAVVALVGAALAGCSPTASAPAPAEPTVAVQAPAEAHRPTRIRIPALGVDAAIIDLGLNPDGTMEVPPDATDAGWYVHSPVPGKPGGAVISAHVDWKGQDGPFARLVELDPGDEVHVELDNGAAVRFVVDKVETHAKAEFPTAAVYDDTEGPELRLVTCGGEFDQASGHYTANVISWAKLAA